MKRIAAIAAAVCLCALLAGCSTTKQLIDQGNEQISKSINDNLGNIESAVNELVSEMETSDKLGKIGDAFSNLYYDDSELYSVGSGTADVSSMEIEIHWVAGSVEIKYYDGDVISFSESSDTSYDESQQLHYLEKDGKLTIQYAAPGKIDVNSRKTLVLKLPGEYSAQKLKIHTVSADINTDGLSASEVDIETISGTAYFDYMNLYSVDVETISGDIFLFGTLWGEADIDSVSGDTMFALREGTGFTCEFNTINGEFYSVFPTTAQANTYICGDGSLKIKADTVSGDIDIEELEPLG